MTIPLHKSRRFIRLAEIALALPEATCEQYGQHASFDVRKKKFAYYLDDHHGDGIVAVCFRTESGENEALVATDPARFYKPAYIGPRGWIGLRLDVGETDWEEVTDFVTDSYRMTAPKRLASRFLIVEEADGEAKKAGKDQREPGWGRLRRLLRGRNAVGGSLDENPLWDEELDA